MKNKLIDLNDHLFEQLERLQDEDLDIDTEVKRTKAITDIAKNIIDNANLALEAQKYFNDLDFTQNHTPDMFMIGNKEDGASKRS